MLSGTFGRIFQGTLLSEGENNFGADQEIIVKTVTGKIYGNINREIRFKYVQ